MHTAGYQVEGTSTMDPRLDQGRWLRIPGPTPLHPAVVGALPHEMVPHRGPVMQEMMARIQPIARAFHGTVDGRVLLYPGSGTAGFEAAIVNLLAPGDHVVATVAGDFGERFAKVGDALGVDVHRLKVEWGEAIRGEQLSEAIAAHGDVKAVFLTHNETSTGVTQPLAELAAVAREAGALVLVDAVSSAGAIAIEMDAWGLDWVLSGAQKAWMCPPGLMISAVSERALHVARANTGFPRYFWDAVSMAEASDQHYHPTTGPQTSLFAFDAALCAMQEEGRDTVFARHAELAAHVRERLTDMGLRLLADPAFASNTVTAFFPPEGATASQFRDRLREHSGIEIAVGQGKLADAVNRLGHMGWVARPELDATLEAIAALV
jgi:aspartate aminotransferase-like enzyme